VDATGSKFAGGNVSDDKPRQHSVEDGRVLRTSVSAMQTYDECARKWRFKYVDHLPDKPPSKGQLKGTQGHKRIELYEKGALDVLSPLEKKGVEKGFIPTPGPGLLIEHDFNGVMLTAQTGETVKSKPLYAHDVPLAGYIDLVNLRVQGKIIVDDWKFKKSIEEYGIRKHQIFDPDGAEGIQLIGYGRWAAINFPDRETIEAAHTTFQTEGIPDVVRVFDEKPLDFFEPLWQIISDRIVPGMKRAAVADNPFEVAGNTKACRKYGGCAFLNKCYDPMERFAANLKMPVEGGGSTMGLLSFGAKKTEPTPASSVAPSNQGTAATAALTPEAAVSATPVPSQAPLKAESAGAASAPSSSSRVYTQPAHDNSVAARKIIIEGDTGPWQPPSAPPAVGIVPPDSPRNSALAAPGMGSSPAPASPLAGPTAGAVSPPPGEPPKAKRGRPSKAELAARAAQLPGGSQSSTAIMGGGAGASSLPASAAEVQTPTAATRPPQTPQVLADPTRPGGAPVTRRTRLFRGCEPIGVPTKSLLPYTLALEKQLLEAFQINMPIPDLRLCDDKHGKELAFGRWQAALAASVELGDVTGDYVVDTRDARVLCVADALSLLLEPLGQSFRGI
jgi:PD-(D/E)XK nuclease superfamily protein